MGDVRRIYVEKKEKFAIQAKELEHEIKSYLGIKAIEKVRVLMRYDIENISDITFEKACKGIFAEPPVDNLYQDTIATTSTSKMFSVEFLPGQFDQRADSAVQCVQFLNADEKPIIRSATTYIIEGHLNEDEFEEIKNYCINPVDSRETGIEIPETLAVDFKKPENVLILTGFCDMTEEESEEVYNSLNLAMTMKDFLHIKKYFTEEERNPSITEIRVLDTYWSDHCRHTTFSTELTQIDFGEGDYKEPIVKTYRQYIKDHQAIFQGKEGKFICLMDLALMAMRKLKKEGKLKDQEETDEINACSIVVPVSIDGVQEEWLINFKNETHNHPTEIEPFGGAATCLGGAIRDPLSGRTYVYQAMRVSGASDPTGLVKDTLKGKLPQKKIVRSAAHGYSSYGNQIGLATGAVKEIYHPNYVAKHMEIGAVLGAAPRKSIIREDCDPGDIIILLGGRTGRDGCGGATGSSKEHTEDSIETCGAEVQKGNAPTERKIQRLFRRPEASKLIKKCNDFGAGGVSVAIGELAEGLYIDLDKVPKKYAGLDGTEIAISESQERMAVVVAPENVRQFLDFSKEENLEAVEVAVVTENKRLVLAWQNEEIVNISRAFLDTNGAHQEAAVMVEIPCKKNSILIRKEVADIKSTWLQMLKDLNVCSQKGLVEMFDGSIGAGSVFMPHGGKYQLTETQTMVAKLPVPKGKCDTVTMMSFGFDPYLSSWSPYHGAVYAVVDSVAKIVASGGGHTTIRFTFQEYFRRMTAEASRWSQPFASLLGAYEAQLGFGLPSIGGKDSMSGTFRDIDVPPTLVSFAVNVATTKDIISPELKQSGDKLIWVRTPKDKFDLPIYEELKEQYSKLTQDIRDGKVVAAYALDRHGIAAAISKMAFGNGLGVKIEHNVDERDIFKPSFGDIIAEVPAEKISELSVTYTIIGEVIKDAVISYKSMDITLEEAIKEWTSTLEPVFPITSEKTEATEIKEELYHTKDIYICNHKIAQPTVFIPVFPGTNCELDSRKAFVQAGAKVITKVFKNLDATDIRDSIQTFKKAIEQSQIIMFPGGFSAGDEPDGSAKFFATTFQEESMKESVHQLLEERDGLILGICNGFQALIKLGLVPYGKIVGQTKDSPTLTYNTIGRHISKMVYTKVVTNKSPWLQLAPIGNVYANPASHGEGRFVASEERLKQLFANGQVATQYTDLAGRITMDEEWNPNGSYQSIEGITSPDGRVLGKMAHSERRGDSVAINIYGEQDLKIFESGVAYFK